MKYKTTYTNIICTFGISIKYARYMAKNWKMLLLSSLKRKDLQTLELELTMLIVYLKSVS